MKLVNWLTLVERLAIAAIVVLTFAAFACGDEPPPAWENDPPAAWESPGIKVFCDCADPNGLHRCPCPEQQCGCPDCIKHRRGIPDFTCPCDTTGRCTCDPLCQCPACQRPTTKAATDGGPDWHWDWQRGTWTRPTPRASSAAQCPSCGGYGRVPRSDPYGGRAEWVICPTCGGSGVAPPRAAPASTPAPYGWGGPPIRPGQFVTGYAPAFNEVFHFRSIPASRAAQGVMGGFGGSC